MKELLEEIRGCSVCQDFLPEGPRPVLQASKNAKIIIIGQAPGRKVHTTGIPWDDPSGDHLRSWLSVTKEQFYDDRLFALVPMGFCFPGSGKSGDLPPRPECAPLWHEKLLKSMHNDVHTVLIGRYAQNYYLMNSRNQTLTETVRNFADYGPKYFPLPHPSPRNNIWLKKNDWFGTVVLPALKENVGRILGSYLTNND